jgi:ABC-type lipoprotein release transport system permease subunit
MFAVAGIFLAAFGLHVCLAQHVHYHLKEIATTIALGATATQARVSIAWKALRLGLIGMLAGAGAGTLFLPFAQDVIPRLDIPSLSTVAGAFVVVILTLFIGSYAPSRRAASADPATLLRVD